MKATIYKQLKQGGQVHLLIFLINEREENTYEN